MSLIRNAQLPLVDDCEGCGVCCLHMGYPAYIRADTSAPGAPASRAEPYWETLPPHLKDELNAYIDAYRHDRDGLDAVCVWFDLGTRRCRHHEYRPQVCRDFRAGSRGCKDWREYYADLIAEAELFSWSF